MKKQITTTVYTIDEHPNPEAVYNWIRENWHDLNDYTVEEVIESLEALASLMGTNVKYSIGQYRDRGEFIRFGEIDHDILNGLDVDKCPLTGCTYDIDVIQAAKAENFYNLFSMIEKETIYRYSEEALKEHCIANEYYFKENGEFHS